MEEMPKKAIIYTLKLIASILRIVTKTSLVCALAAMLVASRIPTTLEKVLDSGQLHVVSRNGPTTYYEGADGMTGFEYQLAEKFADYLGVELVVHESEDLGQMLHDLSNSQYQMAAAGLTVTEKRQKRVTFSTPYLQITQQLIYRHGEKRPKTIDDLADKNILVIANSSHSERLRELKREVPGLTWQEASDLEMLDLLEMVHKGEIDYTIVDSNAYDMNTSLYPKAHVAFDISNAQDLAWAFTSQKDQSLIKKAHDFFAQPNTLTFIEDTKETFYGHLGKLDYSGALVFTKRVKTRLPKWKEQLTKAAEENDLDWRLLAAISYQESHWNPKAKSHTGVRGFMMLTRNTAKEVGVKNRLNASQSIKGGAQYFKKMHNRVPETIGEPDRTWLALAAYNMGYGHVKDAQRITELEGDNPNKWVDVRERVLALEKRKYYKFTRHGYARGSEAVEYVRNIRNFHTIIAWAEKEELQQLAKSPKLDDPNFAQLSPVVTEAVKSIALEAL